MGSILKEGFNKIAEEKNLDAECIGLPPRLQLIIKDETGNDSLLFKSLFIQELVENGIFMHPHAILLCYKHSKDEIEFTLREMEKALSILKDAIEKGDVKNRIRGKVAKEVIRRL